MTFKHDFYTNFQVNTKEDVDNLISGSGKYAEIKDVYSRIILLSSAFGVQTKFPNRKGSPNKIAPDVYAKVGEGEYPCGLKALIHSNGNFNDYIACKLSELSLLGINQSIDISTLPKGTWLIEFPITLKKPFISKDDIPFYIIENPVRKDKIFGVPFTSATAWKGNLRWTMMKIYLETAKNDTDQFAEIRFQHTLLFGSEKGMEDTPTGLTKYLDSICPEAKDKYREKLEELKEKFELNEIPKFTGMLHFYPTFWDRIDMEVINPHDRKTKTGKNPIYYEVVPAGAKGFFRLLYVPFYYLGLPDNELKEKVLDDLRDVIKELREMMLTYGFSAKKSSGYGVIEDKWDRDNSKIIINGVPGIIKFDRFNTLENKIENLRRKL